MTAPLPSVSQLEQEIENMLGLGAGQLPFSAAQDNDLYEALVWAIVLDEIAQHGAVAGRPELVDSGGQRATTLRFRRAPGSLGAAVQPYTHAVVYFRGDAPALEVHVGIKVTGSSGVEHECDVLVLPAEAADRARAEGIDVRYRSVVFSAEAKFLAPASLPLRFSREAVGLQQELGHSAYQSIVATRDNPNLRDVLEHWSIGADVDVYATAASPPDAPALRREVRRAIGEWVHATRNHWNGAIRG